MIKNKLPATRRSVTKRFVIDEKKFYLTSGEYPDGTLGEIFIEIDKEGSRLRVYDALAIAVSVGLQYGIPLSEYCDKMIGLGFEPSGITSDPKIVFAKSPVDFIFRWLKNRYMEG